MSARNIITSALLAVAMCVAYFYIVTPYAVGVRGDFTNLSVFSTLSNSQHLSMWGDVWNGRLAGMTLTGWLFDYCHTLQSYINAFGLYQVFWLVLIFTTSMFAFTYNQSLAVNAIVFAGLVYDLTPAGSSYIYPWDMPATFFLFMVVVFFWKKFPGWTLLLPLCVGCFFKETVLVGALLFLFMAGIRWWKRSLLFLTPFLVYAVGKHLWLGHYGISSQSFSMGDASSIVGLFTAPFVGGYVVRNIHTLNTPTWNSVLLVNGGTVLAAVLLCGKKLLPYTTVLIAYLAGVFLYGSFREFHDFMQVLPMCAMMLVVL